MLFIHLNRGYITTIDDCDVQQTYHNWTIDKTKDGQLYAIRYIDGHNLRLHVAIMQPAKGFEVDHRDRNGLNNCRNNLRLATHSQNSANCLPRSKRKYKGVYWNTRDQYWYVRIQCRNKDYYLGTCITEKEGALRYNDKAIELFGEFARLNVIED